MRIIYKEDIIQRLDAAIEHSKVTKKPIHKILLTDSEWILFKDLLQDTTTTDVEGWSARYKGIILEVEND